MRTQSLLAWLERLLAALDVPQAVLIGSSLGALLARLYAASQPERVRALVLVNGGTLPSVPPAMRRVARQPIVGRAVFHLVARSTLTPVELRRAVKSPSVLSADFLAQARVSAGAFSELMRAFAAGDLPPQRTPAQSTLLLWGADDQVNTLAEAERIKNAIPGAALIPVSDCGLLPQHEAPDVFVWQITRFLTNLDRPARPDLPGVSLLQT
jgi:pimeloyl-ACP methyl ester carboxylesterase